MDWFVSVSRIRSDRAGSRLLLTYFFLGVMICDGNRVCIDAYYLTNFEGIKPEHVMAKRVS